MKGYTIQHSIELLEKAVEGGGGSGGGGTAASVSYNNTSSGLVATNVQAAIDELKTDLTTVASSVPTIDDYGLDFSAGEKLVGKWVDGSDLYAQTIDIGALPNAATSKTYAHNISGNIVRYNAAAIDSGGVCIQLPFYSTAQNYNIGISVNSTNVTIETQRDSSGYAHCYVTLYYTKPANNTRNKKVNKGGLTNEKNRIG